jgi:hypothetical protein
MYDRGFIAAGGTKRFERVGGKTESGLSVAMLTYEGSFGF